LLAELSDAYPSLIDLSLTGFGWSMIPVKPIASSYNVKNIGRLKLHEIPILEIFQHVNPSDFANLKDFTVRHQVNIQVWDFIVRILSYAKRLQRLRISRLIPTSSVAENGRNKDTIVAFKHLPEIQFRSVKLRELELETEFQILQNSELSVS
jgi:hypothetical protein